MNKREVVLGLLNSDTPTAYIPAAFFLHFDPRDHHGQAAIDKHLEFFNHTGMDFVKIQYENLFPHRPDIISPADWKKMPCYGKAFYEDHWNIVEKLVAEAKKDALVIVTLYSPFMCAEHSVSRDLLSRHLLEDRDKTKKGIETITDSLMIFVKGCIERGVDGFYHSTKGGETHRFESSPIFDECIKPFDLALMDEINAQCEFNILHVCDNFGEYADFSPYLDYPGHLVSTPLKWGEKNLDLKEVAEIFNRPVMGGLDRHGIITKGSKNEIVATVNIVCDEAPGKFMIGADCTLPSDTDWENVKTAIDAAHNYKR
jgi:uroporphyrinogen decarboxylase